MKRTYRIVILLALLVLALTAITVSANATELKTGIGIVDAGSLRLRGSASTDGEIISTASRGDAVIIIREVGDWYLVNYNLDIGYMYKEYVTFKEKENVKIGYASFDSSSNVRKGPGTDTGVVAQAPKGETCFIIGFNCSWYKVSYNGNIGYVRSDLLTLLEKPYSNAGSPGNTYKEDSKPAESQPAESQPAPSASDSTPAQTSTPAPASETAGSDVGQKMANYALQFVGYRYVYGGSSPSTGFDCSGLTSYVARQFGFSIGRTADAQLSAGSYVSRSDLRPGDIVLFERTYTTSARATHAGFYIGDGKFVHAANSRTGVVVSSLDQTYYSTRFICGRRLG